jgi:hypothetical protein
MPNHFHLLLRQDTNKSISSFMHRLTVSHAMYFNKRYDRVGHLFQGRFQVKPIIKDEYLLHLSRYIHLNPLKLIGSNSNLEKYPWSSYAEYLDTDCKEGICKKEIILQQFNISYPSEEYKKFVDSFILPNDLLEINHFIIEDE